MHLLAGFAWAYFLYKDSQIERLVAINLHCLKKKKQKQLCLLKYMYQIKYNIIKSVQLVLFLSCSKYLLLIWKIVFFFFFLKKNTFKVGDQLDEVCWLCLIAFSIWLCISRIISLKTRTDDLCLICYNKNFIIFVLIGVVYQSSVHLFYYWVYLNLIHVCK